MPDDPKEPEPIKVERAITNRIKKLKNSPPKNPPSLPPGGVPESKSDEKPPDNKTGDSLQCKQLEETVVDDKKAIDSALIEAFQRLDQNIEVNQGMDGSGLTGRPNGPTINLIFRNWIKAD